MKPTLDLSQVVETAARARRRYDNLAQASYDASILADAVEALTQEQYELEAELDRVRTEAKRLQTVADENLDTGNRLYDAIVRRLTPHFPPGSRDLDWDVLPGTLAQMARKLGEARTRAEQAEAKVDRAQAERATPLAPVEGEDGAVDIEEVLRLATTPAHTYTAAEDRDSALAYAAPALAREVARLTRRETPLIRETIRLQEENEHIRAQAGINAVALNAYRQAVTSALGIDLSSCTEDVQGAVRELQLTIAAEQGKPEGAPSSRWTCDGQNWYGARPDGGMDKIERWSTTKGDGTVQHSRTWIEVDRFGIEKERGQLFDLARVAMLAADAGVEAK